MPQPVPQGGEVLVRLRACGVCFHDVLARQGHFPRTQLPAIIGHEMAGEVAELGQGVAGIGIGERVVVMMKDHCGHCRMCIRARDNLCENSAGLLGEAVPGGYAEYVAVPARALVRIPEGVSFEQAAVVPCALGTAFHGLHTVASVQPGESVLVTGASGGVGIHAVQVARMLGARTIAVTTSEAKRSFLQEYGADEVIVSADLDFAAQARELTGGVGVDVVFNIVGQLAWAAALKSMAVAARHVFVGNLNAAPVSLRPAHAILKEMFFLGTDGVTRAEVHDLLELVRVGRLRPVVGGTLPLAEAARAHGLMESREACGRLVLTM
ncbi:alcohol dehydrogenase catalytic domain-containing protein [Piscinibacter sakaiensis]|uniref:alcohol dehydrogenase catalytic domain-containing protein n=1 Tax=Piscinibacter sakaiensis TaxID=1547922 RepID=UPI003AAD42F7